LRDTDSETGHFAFNTLKKLKNIELTAGRRPVAGILTTGGQRMTPDFLVQYYQWIDGGMVFFDALR
jgi:hypothetical protein